MSQLREHYPSKWYFLTALVTALISLWVYKMTSIAIGKNLATGNGWQGLDYFNFIVWGELTLMLPMAALDAVPRAVRYAHFSGFLDLLIYRKEKSWKDFFQISGSMLARDFFEVLIMFLLAILVFDLAVNLSTISHILTWLILVLPTFFLVGGVFGLFILLTGRGSGISSQVLFLVSVLSGVYFPVTNFPLFVQSYIANLLPTTLMMNSVRATLAESKGWNISSAHIASLALSTVVLFFALNYLWPKILKIRQRRPKGIVPIR